MAELARGRSWRWFRVRLQGLSPESVTARLLADGGGGRSGGRRGVISDPGKAEAAALAWARSE